MEITTKTTKKEMVDFLRGTFKAVQKVNPELASEIENVGKAFNANEKKVSKDTLTKLVEQVIALNIQPKAENSLKKKPKKGDDDKKKTQQGEEQPENVEESAETANKDTEEVSSATETTKKEVAVPKNADKDILKMFKDELEIKDGDNVLKYTIAKDIKNIEDLSKAIQNNEQLAFLVKWTKKDLKQFQYFNGQLPAPKNFPSDLDITTPIYISEQSIVVYCVSLYTEASYCFLPQDFEEVDGIRYSAGMEYQIYRAVE